MNKTNLHRLEVKNIRQTFNKLIKLKGVPEPGHSILNSRYIFMYTGIERNRNNFKREGKSYDFIVIDKNYEPSKKVCVLRFNNYKGRKKQYDLLPLYSKR